MFTYFDKLNNKSGNGKENLRIRLTLSHAFFS